MSQDRGEPAEDPREPTDPSRDGNDGPDRTQAFDPRSAPDSTQAFDPLAEEPPAGGGRDPDQTRAFDPRSRSESTRRQAAGSPSWSGRAGVPPPRPSGGTAEPTGWGEYDSSGGRPWWTPILIGLLALVLLGVLGTALWLAWDRTDREAPVSPSPSATSPESTPTPTPTATTGQPTPSRTSAAPIPVPPLVGLSLEPAQALLNDLGLTSRLQFVPSDRPAGTVVDTDPGAGALVDRGDAVTLVVAQPRRSLPVSPATPPAPAPPTGSGP